jgi:tetratricopeptide (TPR) repeat protein
LRSIGRAVLLCIALVAGGAERAAAADAITQLRHTLAAEERRSGAASPILLPLLERLAAAQRAEGAFADAVAVRRRALKIALASYGGGSPNAAAAMLALAELDIEGHRYLDAEPLLTTASLAVGSDSAAMAEILAAQARIALARGEVDRAEALAGRAVAIPALGKKPGSTEPLRVLGAVYASQERFDSGEPLLQLALSRDRAAHGEVSAETARSAAQLANLLLRQKRYADALPTIEQALAIDQARFGPTHPLIADDFCDLGLIYDGLDRPVDARTALNHAITLLERGAGGETARLAYAEIELARILRAGGDTHSADIAVNDAQRILKAARAEERERERQI